MTAVDELPSTQPTSPTSRWDRWHVAPTAAKVPAIGLTFWAIKLLTTGIGEALSDGMANFFLPLAALVGVGGTALAFRQQYRSPEYHAWTYWTTVLTVAIFGTMVADGLKLGLGLTYAVTTPLFAVAVATVFTVWYRSEGTLSIHSITTRRRENFYWVAVLMTFALGTAAGDLTAYQLNLGFFPSAALYSGLMGVVAIAWRLGLNPIAAFWAAYVITRPLGASVADGFSKTHAESGLNMGDGTVGLIGLVLFLLAVGYTARTGHDKQDPAEAHAYDHQPFPHADHLHERVHAHDAPVPQNT
jgi:uncharacterized membrane-anchored protein